MGELRKPAIEPVLRYMKQHVGKILTLGEIVEATGVIRNSVPEAVSAIERFGYPVERRGRGVYVLHRDTATTPPAKPEPEPVALAGLAQGDVLEVAHVSRQGTLLVEDAEHRIYRIVPLTAG